MHIDLSPLYTLLNNAMSELLQGLAVFIAGWAMYAFHKYAAPIVGARLESKASDDLNTALENGVRVALTQMQAWENVHKDVEVKSAVQRFAVQYAIDHAGDAVDRFGLSPDQLALKALAYLPPPPPSTIGTTGVGVTAAPVAKAPLPAKGQ